MLYGEGYNQYQQSQPEGDYTITWLDYLIASNPQGVMRVLASYGYTGYLAPQDEDEMAETCLDLMDKHGESAVIDLLKSHPLYEVIAGISREDTSISFRNADGSQSVLATIKTINYRLLIENALIIIGAIYLGRELWSYLTKNEYVS
jgi:hypothetical protein